MFHCRQKKQKKTQAQQTAQQQNTNNKNTVQQYHNDDSPLRPAALIPEVMQDPQVQQEPALTPTPIQQSQHSHPSAAEAGHAKQQRRSRCSSPKMTKCSQQPIGPMMCIIRVLLRLTLSYSYSQPIPIFLSHFLACL